MWFFKLINTPFLYTFQVTWLNLLSFRNLKRVFKKN